MQTPKLLSPLVLLPIVCALALPAAGRRVERLDVPVQTPVYRVPSGLPLPHEQLRYSLRWVGIPLGGVEVEMAPDADRAGLAFSARGATTPAISWIYSYRFSAQGVVQTAPFAPGGFEVDSCEGSRREQIRILFPEGPGPIRSVREKRGRIKEYVFHSDNSYDVPSAVYLMLNLDYEPGARYRVDAFTGETRYLVSMRVVGLERIEVDGDPVPAWHLELGTQPLTEEDPDRVHRGTHVWISPERPRRVLRARAETFVGHITLELEGAGGGGRIDASCS